MKIPPYTIDDIRLTRSRKFPAATSGTGAPASTLQRFNASTSSACRAERGVALIITLILLSVTLVMAVAFLAISRRERGSVATESDTTAAKFAADSALAHAEARIVAQILVTTNPYVQPLLVSTNYFNSFGFNPISDNGIPNLTNVNYVYRINNGGALAGLDLAQNIANLYFNPRPPVFYGSNANDFRYYLDLNRNGRYDTNGVVTNVDMALRGLGSASLQVGDPEWIGVLEHPDQPHGPNNQFIARYCFIAVPADSLDLNEIHNQAHNAVDGNNNFVSPPTGDAYRRNQGVGTWEINLAAFLTDLNPNRWDAAAEPYLYPAALAGNSFAFDDARSLIAWRYGGNYSSLQSANNVFGNAGAILWLNSGLDGYSVWSQTTLSTNYAGNYVSANFLNPSPSQPWLGAPNANDYFYSPSELFDSNKSSAQFVNSIYNVGISNDTYDRYTFYRMLDQIGSDSAPESGKINVNFSNAVVNCDANGVLLNLTVIPNLETNFSSWKPQAFFTAAADKMLHAYSSEWFQESPTNYLMTYYGLPYIPSFFPNITIAGMYVTNVAYAGQVNQIPAFGITNIPVYVNGQFVYTPAVNRVLQLAANIYDSVSYTNDPFTGISNYPSIFRPVFWTTNEFNPTLGKTLTDVYIKGYQYVVEPLTTNGNPIFNAPVEVTTLPTGITTSNVWGVPWIIGAKKGFPNFNGFEWNSSFFIERELQFKRDTITASGTAYPFGRRYTTNQMYFIGVSNVFGCEHWNSYAEAYNNKATVVAQDWLTVQLTNSDGIVINNPFETNGFASPQPWQGNTYVMPFGTNMFVSQQLNPNYYSTNNVYLYFYGPGSINAAGGSPSFAGPIFVPTQYTPPNYPDTGTPQLPQFGMTMTNRMRAYIIDNNGYILDYVQLGSMNGSLNVNEAISDADGSGFWSTNGYSGGDMPYGVYEQWLVSEGGQSFPAADSDEGGGTPAQGWTTAQVPGAGGDTTPPAQQAFFHAFFTDDNKASYKLMDISNTELSIQAPFTPMRLISQRFVYMVNDPLVHYLASDLYDPAGNTNSRVTMSAPPAFLQPPLGIQSDRYMPWGTMGKSWPGAVGYDGNLFNFSYRDSLVRSSDNWDFPTNIFPSIGWIGRVHRGTPWQSVYMKSTNLLSLLTPVSGSQTYTTGINTWQVWTGNGNPFDATNSAPIQDRMLFDLFTATPNDDATRGRLSINLGADDPNNLRAGLAAWSAVLSGLAALTNNYPNQQIGFNARYQDPIPGKRAPDYSITNIQPAGVNPGNSQVGQIVAAIDFVRAHTTNIDGLTNVFEHAGDVLSVPALSDAIPFLNSANIGQQTNGISDEMYEWVPQQIMGLVTVNGTPQAPQRYVVYCYGQTLKPAPNGIVTGGGAFFGLVTNYQVTAESGTRAIIRVENTPTPANPTATPHVVVEQYNPLPPD
jgi:hypothetical protein